jgi:phospholipid/cholesterol/gamma-HCH transport system ATP-binding protein
MADASGEKGEKGEKKAPPEQEPRDPDASGNGRAEAEIGLKDLTKTFGSQTVWEGITCDIPKGKITVMLGPSGTGKSVLLKHIMGLLKPDRGEIWIDGKNIPSLPERELYKVRRKFGVLFQDGALFGSMNVFDNTAFPLREHTKKGEKEIRDIVTEKLTMVGLVGAEKKLPGEISGGMKKRAGLARALVLDPEIVMFDEPDSGLDPVRTAFLSELIRDLNAQLGMCSVVVTHDIATCRRVADYIGMLAQGKLVKFGTAKEMFESDIPVVRQFLAGDTEGPIGMAEEKDEDILGEGGGELPRKEPDQKDRRTSVRREHDRDEDEVQAKSSAGMTAEETEEMERAAGASDEEKVRILKREEEADASKQGTGLPDGFSLEKMLRQDKEEQA